MCGGSGTRLWPLSRKSYPKQFVKILGDKSLFQQTAIRFNGSGLLQFSDPLIVTNENFRFTVVQQLSDLNMRASQIILEPQPKNTAPAILAAASLALTRDENALLFIAASDHRIDEDEKFSESIQRAIPSVLDGKIATFGIDPEYPETGFGYIELDKQPHNDVFNVKKFIEKPNLTTAEAMVAQGDFVWNAGMFMFRAVDIIKEFELYAPDLTAKVTESVSSGSADSNFFRLGEKPWTSINPNSIDYLVLEKSDNLVAAKLLSDWSDLGSWETVWKEMEPNAAMVSTSENAHAIDCTNTLLRSENESQQIVGMGLDNIIAIAMPDAVLVASKNKGQDIKRVVEVLHNDNVKQALEFPKDHRPWGWFESLFLSDRFQVKQLFVNPGAALSLQSHVHRSEHWVVVEGSAKITVGDQVSLLREGESVFIPLGERHRLENPGKIALRIIEVQSGSYLGEDDIVRYQDNYHRK